MVLGFVGLVDRYGQDFAQARIGCAVQVIAVDLKDDVFIIWFGRVDGYQGQAVAAPIDKCVETVIIEIKEFMTDDGTKNGCDDRTEFYCLGVAIQQSEMQTVADIKQDERQSELQKLMRHTSD